MTMAMKTSVGLVTLALAVGGAVWWTRCGSLVYFDVMASSFIGCFL